MKPNKLLNGLRCCIYRDYVGVGKLSAIARTHDEVTLVGPGIQEVFPANEECPAVSLHRISVGKTCFVVARPVAAPPAGTVGWMFDGAFIYTTDSRFPGCGVPIPLHDRFEVTVPN